MDFLESVECGSVIPSSEYGADAREGCLEFTSHEVHRHLSRVRNLFLSPFFHEVHSFDLVVFFDHPENIIQTEIFLGLEDELGKDFLGGGW